MKNKENGVVLSRKNQVDQWNRTDCRNTKIHMGNKNMINEAAHRYRPLMIFLIIGIYCNDKQLGKDKFGPVPHSILWEKLQKGMKIQIFGRNKI